MNLVVDLGNTQIKFAVFDEHRLLQKINSAPEQAHNTFSGLLKSYPKLRRGILSSTAKGAQSLKAKLSQHLNLVEFSYLSKLNFTNLYETPETLGLDRIALVAAAVDLYPSHNVLIIDAGTCITYDFVDHIGNYHGGAISPGLQMRFKAMHTFTGKLPLIEEAVQAPNYMGRSTKEAMQIGVYKSISYEIDGYIEDYLADYEDLTVVLTGGDYNLLSASIKNSIFATSNFLLKGLNKILQLNSN